MSLASVPHPLGPVVIRKRLSHPVKSRLWAVLLVMALAALLVTAVYVVPDAGARGLPGMRQCDVLVLTGYPCPTCGMTTAFAYTVRGQWLRALDAQPMGWLLAVGTLVGLGMTLVALASGRTWSINWYRVRPERVVIVAVGLFLAAWGYRIVVAAMAST